MVWIHFISLELANQYKVVLSGHLCSVLKHVYPDVSSQDSEHQDEDALVHREWKVSERFGLWLLRYPPHRHQISAVLNTCAIFRPLSALNADDNKCCHQNSKLKNTCSKVAVPCLLSSYKDLVNKTNQSEAYKVTWCPFICHPSIRAFRKLIICITLDIPHLHLQQIEQSANIFFHSALS